MHARKTSLSQKLAFGALVLVAALPAIADVGGGTAIADAAFSTFAATMLAWLNGGLGIGIALAALLVGGATAAATGKPLVMVGAILIAMLFAFGPPILSDLVLAADASVLAIPGLTV